mmetsp:Transcript_40945/g.87210  ORF Transcript_40945/g.87210 Transcript_40945/m.87210 type:complete len:325 (-) Transcript_40945:181-1155(-)
MLRPCQGATSQMSPPRLGLLSPAEGWRSGTSRGAEPRVREEIRLSWPTPVGGAPRRSSRPRLACWPRRHLSQWLHAALRAAIWPRPAPAQAASASKPSPLSAFALAPIASRTSAPIRYASASPPPLHSTSSHPPAPASGPSPFLPAPRTPHRHSPGRPLRLCWRGRPDYPPLPMMIPSLWKGWQCPPPPLSSLTSKPRSPLSNSPPPVQSPHHQAPKPASPLSNSPPPLVHLPGPPSSPFSPSPAEQTPGPPQHQAPKPASPLSNSPAPPAPLQPPGPPGQSPRPQRHRPGSGCPQLARRPLERQSKTRCHMLRPSPTSTSPSY